ncbi:hypothetical protein GCM10028796_17270 [Ramlibacter monticola]|uniref:DUF1367 family protein n=1 Tax=Ramlibacter monticola TaxID=1926872 RepID=A0A936YXA7_9BURK|nr:DUF1367 family protein [Ramlibacter monticola]MBL0390553.1 DUF1367 family protein [Ramlibacter monticola]
MPDILLVRQEAAPIAPADAEAARRVLFGTVDGLGEQHSKSWRRFINRLFRLEPGEVVEIKTHQARSGPFHRRHFALEQALFEAQERFEHFDQFLYWIKVGAGWVTWAAGPAGGVVPIPRSVSFAAADQEAFEDFHQRVVAFLRGPHAARYLWPHLKDRADGMMNQILEGFSE